MQDALLSPSPSEDWPDVGEPVAPVGSEALPAPKSAPVGLVSVQDVIGAVAMKAEPNAESRCVSLLTSGSLPLLFALVAVVVTVAVGEAGQWRW